ncbi:hypothetical protein BQ8794_140197 [Mesorhizobium prunaredense]|uniref:Uncharacterized protein n=1 Tax=Mesorhizobium prunaredense TaxID=1631249 RepID=A0A1R3V2C9_9HYPH|nr:hypothetical protein BQ8794_140197 [Mesorhizobium prunaredense]
MHVFGEVATGRDIARRRVEAGRLRRRNAVLDGEPLVIAGVEIGPGCGGADARWNELAAIRGVLEQELRDVGTCKRAGRRDIAPGLPGRIGRVDIERRPAEQRLRRDATILARTAESGELVELVDGGEHVLVLGVVRQLGQRNVSQERLPVELDGLARPRRAIERGGRRDRELRADATREVHGEGTDRIELLALAAQRYRFEVGGIARGIGLQRCVEGRAVDLAAFIMRQPACVGADEVRIFLLVAVDRMRRNRHREIRVRCGASHSIGVLAKRKMGIPRRLLTGREGRQARNGYGRDASGCAKKAAAPTVGDVCPLLCRRHTPGLTFAF